MDIFECLVTATIIVVLPLLMLLGLFSIVGIGVAIKMLDIGAVVAFSLSSILLVALIMYLWDCLY